MDKNLDPVSGINIPDPLHCIGSDDITKCYASVFCSKVRRRLGVKQRVREGEDAGEDGQALQWCRCS